MVAGGCAWLCVAVRGCAWLRVAVPLMEVFVAHISNLGFDGSAISIIERSFVAHRTDDKLESVHRRPRAFGSAASLSIVKECFISSCTPSL
jgi:hypothetical protein